MPTLTSEPGYTPLVEEDDDDSDVKGDVTNQEVHACTKHPYNRHDRHHLGNTNMAVPLNDMQQLQKLRRVEQPDETQELQTFTKKTQQCTQTSLNTATTVTIETSETTLH